MTRKQLKWQQKSKSLRNKQTEGFGLGAYENDCVMYYYII